MGKTYRIKEIKGIDTYKSTRKSWGTFDPTTRVVRPKKGGGYKRREKFGNKWDAWVAEIKNLKLYNY